MGFNPCELSEANIADWIRIGDIGEADNDSEHGDKIKETK